MPTYDYRCETNGQVVEVKHGMNESLSTWGELCALTGADLGNTPGDAAVTRLITGGHIAGASGGFDDIPASPCGAGGCGGGFCGLN